MTTFPLELRTVSTVASVECCAEIRQSSQLTLRGAAMWVLTFLWRCVREFLGATTAIQGVGKVVALGVAVVLVLFFGLKAAGFAHLELGSLDLYGDDAIFWLSVSVVGLFWLGFACGKAWLSTPSLKI